MTKALDRTPQFIKDRDKNDQFRKEQKKKIDSSVNLSNLDKNEKSHYIDTALKSVKAKKNQTVRLLDEGAVLYGDGSIRFFIKKGSLQNFYDKLSSEYVGSINLGHMPFGQYPKVLGTWTKEDLSLVDVGEGRKALDVKLNLDDRISDVQDLIIQKREIGVSVEMYNDVDWDATDLMGFLVYNSVDIRDFAIVGDVGNVNSGGIVLNNSEGVTEINAEGEFKYMGKFVETLKFWESKLSDANPETKDATADTADAGNAEGTTAQAEGDATATAQADQAGDAKQTEGDTAGADTAQDAGTTATAEGDQAGDAGTAEGDEVPTAEEFMNNFQTFSDLFVKMGERVIELESQLESKDLELSDAQSKLQNINGVFDNVANKMGNIAKKTLSEKERKAKEEKDAKDNELNNGTSAPVDPIWG